MPVVVFEFLDSNRNAGRNAVSRVWIVEEFASPECESTVIGLERAHAAQCTVHHSSDSHRPCRLYYINRLEVTD
jgi:hypothetical protein